MMVFERVDENIFLFIDETFYDAVVGAIVLPTKLVMIDSGMYLPKVKEFRKMVEDTTGKKFEILVLTHFHGDHTLGNQIFSDCRIISSKPVLEKMKGMKVRWTEEVIEKEKERLEDPSALEGLVITIPNETFDNQLEIIDGDVKVIVKKTGGHVQ